MKKSDHAIVYTGRSLPYENASESASRGETGMRPRAIRVDVDIKGDKLDAMSRIDFGKPHTIHHNLKVRSFGKVNRESIPHLIYQFDAVWARDVGAKTFQHSIPPASRLASRGAASGDIWRDAYESLIARGYSREQVSEFVKQRYSGAAKTRRITTTVKQAGFDDNLSSQKSSEPSHDSGDGDADSDDAGDDD